YVCCYVSLCVCTRGGYGAAQRPRRTVYRTTKNQWTKLVLLRLIRAWNESSGEVAHPWLKSVLSLSTSSDGDVTEFIDLSDEPTFVDLVNAAVGETDSLMEIRDLIYVKLEEASG